MISVKDFDWPDPKPWWDTIWGAMTRVSADIGMKPGTLLLVCALLVGAAVFILKLIRARKGG